MIRVVTTRVGNVALGPLVSVLGMGKLFSNKHYPDWIYYHQTILDKHKQCDIRSDIPIIHYIKKKISDSWNHCLKPWLTYPTAMLGVFESTL